MFVYLFARGDNGPCKIGISKAPDQRLRMFIESGHFDLKMVTCWRSDTARRWELAAHKALADKRIAGEWFAVDAAYALSTIEALRAEYQSASLRPVTRKGSGPVETARVASAASIAARKEAIEAGLQVIKRDWLLGKVKTKVLLHGTGITYATARRVLGARRKYIRRKPVELINRGEIPCKHAVAEKARAQAACAIIKDRWYSNEYPTEALLKEAGISRNTALLYLGKRPPGRKKRIRKSTWVGPAFTAYLGS